MINTKQTLNKEHQPIVNMIIVMAVTLSLIFTPFQQTMVSATSFYDFIPGYGTPTIDGNVEVSEWAEADSYTQVMVGSTTGLTGTLYVLQDWENLYLGFIIDDDELTVGDWYGILGDTLEINFDDDNSGSLYEVGENKISIDSVTPIRDAHYVNTSGGSSADTQLDGQGLLVRQSGTNHFELAFPLCSGDTDDFCLTGGDTLGLQLQYNDYDTLTAEPTPAPDGSRLPGLEVYELVTIEIQNFYASFLPIICH